MGRDHYKKRLYRLLKIITLIQAKPGWNVRKLAAECGVTPRTIYRDLEVLERVGVPYFHDSDTGGYRIRGDFFLPPVDLTLEEALALAVLADQIGHREQVPHLKGAAQAAIKIRSQLPAALTDGLHSLDGHIAVHLARSASPHGTQDVYETVRQAIVQRRALSCRYESPRSQAKPETFLFHPYCLYWGQRAWYTVGHHQGRQALRCLKLSRFTQIKLTKQRYTIPEGFSLARHLGKAWRMIPGGRTYHVELRFDPNFAETIADTHWHDTQQIDWQEDGSIRFRCEVDGLDEIVWWVLSMGPHCKVIRPKALAQRVRSLAQQTLALYQERHEPGSKASPPMAISDR